MATGVYLLAIILPEDLNIQLKLIIEVLMGIVLYTSLAYTFNLKAFLEAKIIAKNYIKKFN